MGIQEFVQGKEATLEGKATQERYCRQAFDIGTQIIDKSSDNVISKERMHPADCQTTSDDADSLVNFYSCATTPFVETAEGRMLSIRSRVANDDESWRDFQLLAKLSDGTEVVYACVSNPDHSQQTILYADPQSVHIDGRYSEAADQEVVELFRQVGETLDKQFGSSLMATAAIV